MKKTIKRKHDGISGNRAFRSRYCINIKDFIRNNIGILVLISIFLFIRIIFLTTRYHLPGWDESVYIGMGKYLYSLGTIGLWESIRPLGLPIITGAFWSVGLDPIVYGELLVIILASASIYLTYAIGKRVFNKSIALIGAIILASTPTFFQHSGLIMSEIPSLFFTMLAVYSYLKKKYFWTGISIGVATMFRFTAGLILLIIGLDMLIDSLGTIIKSIQQKNKRIKDSRIMFIENLNNLIKIGLRYISGFIIVLLPFLIYNYRMYREYTANASDALFRPFILGSLHQSNIFESISTATLYGKIHNIVYYLIALVENNILLVLFIAGIIICWKYARKVFISKGIFQNYSSNGSKNNLGKDNISKETSRDALEMGKNPFRIIWLMTIIYLFYLTLIINKQERFIIMILPFITLLSALAIYKTYKVFSKRRRQNDYTEIIQLSMISIFVFALTYSVSASLHYYTWQAPLSEPPRIVDEYYRYFYANGIDGTILTTDPVFTYYSDNKFIPYYDTVSDVRYLNPWEVIEPVKAIVYTSYAIPCIEDDLVCIENRRLLLEHWMQNRRLAYNYTNDYAERYIFID